MDNYFKFLIVVAILAIVGIPFFVMDLSDLSWQNNREAYWGVFAMFALIGFVVLYNHSNKLAKRIKDAEKNAKTNPLNNSESL